MNRLNVSIETIKRIMNMHEDWKNIVGTNCYAFALGLDVKEEEIMEEAYKLGYMSCAIEKKPIIYNRILKFEDRLKNDLTSLQLNFNEVEPDYNCKHREWKIVLMKDAIDFHFLRQSQNDGLWYQKMGYRGTVTNKDTNGIIITDPKTCNIKDYEYVKTYALSK